MALYKESENSKELIFLKSFFKPRNENKKSYGFIGLYTLTSLALA